MLGNSHNIYLNEPHNFFSNNGRTEPHNSQLLFVYINFMVHILNQLLLITRILTYQFHRNISISTCNTTFTQVVPNEFVNINVIRIYLYNASIRLIQRTWGKKRKREQGSSEQWEYFSWVSQWNKNLIKRRREKKPNTKHYGNWFVCPKLTFDFRSSAPSKKKNTTTIHVK